MESSKRAVQILQEHESCGCCRQGCTTQAGGAHRQRRFHCWEKGCVRVATVCTPCSPLSVHSICGQMWHKQGGRCGTSKGVGAVQARSMHFIWGQVWNKQGACIPFGGRCETSKERAFHLEAGVKQVRSVHSIWGQVQYK